MGAGPSLGKFLKSMDDEDLTSLVEGAYRLEPQRMEKVFALAKLRYYEETGQQPPREVDAVDAAALSMSAALLPPPPSVSPPAAAPMLTDMMPTSTASANTVQQMNTTAPSMDVMTDATDDPVLNGMKDPMNAIWTFEGHRLRELQPADKNPHNLQQQALQEQAFVHADALKNTEVGGTMSTGGARELDADGHAVLYGSCGRDKRYARCSVCYFRGLRCNTSHYCACCQRPVCIRPRKYPGEEHPKICWNVLHMDKDMIQRVEKKKKRKLQALTAAATASATGSRVSRIKTVEHSGAEHNDRPDESLAGVDIQRAPPIPTVVADVSGAVDL
ncbi:hypothetical protein BBO99_00001520 [Phytophthora kernoviae]|uniref:Uncharacterized protein n=2 Tax=Phytophthora kernoviae TaxID=325452 RepID=A0A3R7JXZ3_9STRA|nr:hypothetical protein G195_010424 [Phytophthora kernoviae 00238/432]KAG2530123.1 hypothetical protein JM18_002392 [Phytophthora kernoviae]KAG2531339.1 hypothetical protein JM16_001098 [Phytophthora kernoviae]RLN20318.1 hypothetical protein BBI17_001343 [Phytophthora kernoviae]RLN84161.1 hypothetical protein BBO99_00001520 [Phytophthora kernoviae]